MTRVVIVVEASGKKIDYSPLNIKMIWALKQAIAATEPSSEIQVVIDSECNSLTAWASKDVIVPLTLNIPPNLPFKAQKIYQDCRDVSGLRQCAAQQLGCCVGNGCYWLPVVVTAKGSLYGEVIKLVAETTDIPENLFLCDLSYEQPFHLSDAKRQQLYQLGKILQLLLVPPATYLIQFGFQDDNICFDRLWPFPAAPAIASLGVQKPDLFACHWYCLTTQPILDLSITPSVTDQVSLTLSS